MMLWLVISTVYVCWVTTASPPGETSAGSEMAALHREPLGIWRYSFSKARAHLCPFSAFIWSLSTRIEIAFESLFHVIVFPGHLREQPFSSWNRERKSCRHPSWEGVCSPRSPVAWSAQALSSGTADWRHWVALLFLWSMESIEMLVRPSFCLSPSHMVLSSVSYFSFFKFLFLGDKISHLNKVLF